MHARHFYVRDLAYGDMVDMIHLPTVLQLADIGCTYKGGATFMYLRKKLIECTRIMFDDNENPFWDMMCDVDHD